MNLRFLSVGRFNRYLCVVLSVVMATGPSMAAVAQTQRSTTPAPSQPRAAQPTRGAQPASSAQPARAAQPGTSQPTAGGATGLARIDTTFVAPDADALIALRPGQIMTSPTSAALPIEVISAAGIKYLGFDPANVEEVVAYAKQPADLQPPEFAVTLKFVQPFRGADISPALRSHTQPGELAGRKYLQSPVPMLPSLYAPDARTLIVAPDATLRKLLEKKDPVAPGPLLARVRLIRGHHDLYAAVDLASLRPLIQGGVAALQMQAQSELPPEAMKFFGAPELISAAELTVNLSNPGVSSFVVHANDVPSAQKLDELIGEALKMYQDAMTAQMAAQMANTEDPVEKAFGAYMQRTSGQWANLFRPSRSGATLTFFKVENSSMQNQMVMTAVGGILIALLLPAIQAAREAARRNQSMNVLKQLALAILNYESAKSTLPPHANYDANGRPLLSWRVHILPYIEEAVLYSQFKLDEPWDSEHNRQLIPRMPAIFANANLPFPREAGRTNYLAVVGPQSAMNGTAEGLRISQITDGTSNTILLVEANAEEAVEWTKPDDLEIIPAGNFLGSLGGLRPSGFLAAFCDGHVEFVSDTVDLQSLPGKFTATGGERIDQGMMQPMMPGEQPRIDPSQFFGPQRGDQPMDMGRGDGRGTPFEPGGRGDPIDDGSRGRGDPGGRGEPENVGRDGRPIR
jgi:hypothetical protein